MHVRIATARTTPGSADHVEGVWRSLLGAYRDDGGYRGMVAMYDNAEDTAITLTMWESADAADEAAEKLRPLAVSAFEGLLLEAPAIKGYELLLVDLPADT